MTARASRQPALTAYVLHRYDWSESSLVLDLFSRELGRLAVVAKGAKRPFSQLRGILLPFQRLHVSLGRQAGDESAREVHALRGVEWVGGRPMPTGAALWNGFYVNELVLKLLARHDPHPVLFDAYADTVQALVAQADDEGQAALRAFELVMLREIGLLPDLGFETTTQRRVAPAGRYRVLADAGVVEAAEPGSSATASGALLSGLQAALAGADLEALRRAAGRQPGELRPILRSLLHYHLGGDHTLRTRRVLREAQALAS